MISGTPTTAGAFNVVVTASDGVNSDSKNFLWTIAQGLPFVLNPLPIATPALAGAQVNFQASATGGAGVQYRWDFDDGTPETAYSSSSSISHIFANPGIYYVTVTAIDSGRNSPDDDRRRDRAPGTDRKSTGNVQQYSG